MRDGYVARWQGEEYDASPAGEDVRLYRTEPADGFEEVRRGRYRRVVPAGEAELSYVRTVCTWRGEPFIMLGDHGEWMRLEYTGGQAPVAAALGLEEFDFGVYQGWAAAGEVGDIREHRV
jgi:hypothetical protein